MADIKIPVDKAEQMAVLNAIKELNAMSHIRYMSRDMIARTAKIKESKVRMILQSLVDAKYIIQYDVTDNPSRQRYYFVLTNIGNLVLAGPTITLKPTSTEVPTNGDSSKANS